MLVAFHLVLDLRLSTPGSCTSHGLESTLGRDYCFGKPVVRCLRRGQGLQGSRILVAGPLARLPCQAQGLVGITEAGVLLGGQDPGQVR